MHQPANRKFGTKILFGARPVFPLGATLLLVGSFFYVWLRVEPHLEYHSSGPYFYRSRVFLDTFLSYPGGLANYAGVFLAQLNYQSWLGALVFVLFASAVFLSACFCLARISGRASGWYALIPIFALLLLRNHYGYPVTALSVGVLLALATSAAYLSLSWKRQWAFVAVSGLLSAGLFLLAGLWSALLFGVLCGLFGAIQIRRWAVGLSCPAFVLVAPVVAIGARHLEVVRLVNPWPAGVDWFLASALYASVPIAGALLAWRPKTATASTANWQAVSPTTDMPAPSLDHWYKSARFSRASVVMMFLLGWAAVWLTFDRRQKLLAEIDYCTSRGEYGAALTAARQVKVLNHAAAVRVRLALFHTGRLAEELFSFHNLMDDIPSEGTGEEWRAQSQPLLELGLINDAEHMAHEALEMQGDRPDLLRLLARINRLKNRPQAAQVFLNVLSLIPFQGEQADEAWPIMSRQVNSAESTVLTEIRARMLTKDAVHEGLPIASLLEVLLASNPTNQMTFEYLMAHYLLDLDLKQAVERLRLLEIFGYPCIPRPYEEALLLYQQVAGVEVQLKGRTIRPETVERFRQFTEAFRQLNGSAEREAALAAHFRDTYWYYYYAAKSRERAAENQSSAP